MGRSETRQALRRHFEVDAESIVIASLHCLAEQGKADAGQISATLEAFGIDPAKRLALFE